MNNYQHHDKAQEPNGYCVVAQDGDVKYTVTISKDAPEESADWAYDSCHEHINECVGYIEGAGQWVVRPFFLGGKPDFPPPPLDEARNIALNSPVFAGDTLSHATARQCEALGWAVRDENSDWVPTEQNPFFELARRVVELESARGEAVGYVLPSGIKQLKKDHPTDIYAPDNPTVPGSYPVWLYTAPPAPAAVPEYNAMADQVAGMKISDNGVEGCGYNKALDDVLALISLYSYNPSHPDSEETEHVCESCGSKGWTANCDQCIPY